VARVQGFEAREFVRVRLDRVRELEEQTPALAGRTPAPGRKRRARGHDGAVDVGRARQGHVCDDGVVVRIPDGKRPPVERVDEAAADEEFIGNADAVRRVEDGRHGGRVAP
jgi:hypothetical protein